jgi:hypothetical protein
MLEMVDTLNERLQEATYQGSERHVALHHKRGFLLGKDSLIPFSLHVLAHFCHMNKHV